MLGVGHRPVAGQSPNPAGESMGAVAHPIPTP
jgi:hypothetical protein